MKYLILAFSVVYLAFAPTQLRAQFACITNTDGTLTITCYTGPGGNVIFPSTINGLTVSSLATGVMLNNLQVTAITIPGSITNFSPAPFNECQALTNVVLGDGITVIPPSMFNECFNLASVTIPESVTSIGTWAFFGSKIASITLPAGITSITRAFANCPALTNINLPYGLTNLDGAFAGCSNLMALTIPSTVTAIGGNTFDGCTGLTNLVIPASVTSIGNFAFYNCSHLTSLIIPAGVTNIPGGTVQGVSAQGAAFTGCFGLTNLAILGAPDIGSNAFYFLTNLASVSIAGGQIGDGAFEYCLNLRNLTLGNGVTMIGTSAFGGCPISGRLYFPSSIPVIGNFAFESLQTRELVFGAGVSNLGVFTFYGDPYLTNVLFLGNAPYVTPNEDQGVFAGVRTTVYYLPNTSGWSNNFGSTTYGAAGSPTAIWNPGISIRDGRLGVSNGMFGFNITNGSTTNLPVAILACTNLANPVWTPLTNITLTNTYYFTDAQWSNNPQRYYGLGFP